MTTLHPKRQLFSLTWPIFLEAVLFSVIGSVDTLMLSHYADNATGGVGAVNQVLSLFQVVSNIITAGTGILCAQYIGAGKSTKEKQPLILGALLVMRMQTVLPLALSFAAGAMILVAVHELIPECQSSKDTHPYFSPMGIVFGFAAMMLLDVLLG